MFAPYLHSLIEQHGYWAVFVIILLECAGVPLPGETALILASVYAGATGNLDIVWVISLAAVAAIMGDNIGFWIGRSYGLPFVQRYGRLLHVSQNHLVVGQYLFAQHGAKVVFFSESEPPEGLSPSFSLFRSSSCCRTISLFNERGFSGLSWLCGLAGLLRLPCAGFCCAQT